MPLLDPRMTHRPMQPMGSKGAAVFDFLDQMRRSSGEAVRAGIGGDYEQFGGMLGDAMGPGLPAKGLLALGSAIGPAWLAKRMWGAPEKAVQAAGKRKAGGEVASLRGSSKAPSIEEAMKYAEENGLTLKTAHGILTSKWMTDEVNKLDDMARSLKPPPLTERFPPAPDDVAEAPRGLLGDAFKRQRGRIGDFDPRFDPRIKEQERLQNLDVSVAGSGAQPGLLSIADFEGKPFISSMSDRTRAGGDLVGVNNRQLNSPVGLLGGQDYMFNNPGQVWASGAAPVRQIHGLAQDVKRLTGEDPLFMPWRMAPTGGDFAHMTGETMLSYADVGMNKKNKAKANTAIKKLIPGWKGIGDPASIEQFRNAPDAVRKTIKNTLDTRFRDAGGLGIGEARLAVSDPAQYMAKDSGLMNVGRIHAGRPIVADSGHPSYPKGIPGEGLGRLKEDLNVFQLLPDVVRARGMDAMSPRQTDIRAMQMKPYAGIITPELLKSLGL